MVDRNRRFACQCKLKNAFTSFVVDLCMTVCYRMHYAYWLIYFNDPANDVLLIFCWSSRDVCIFYFLECLLEGLLSRMYVL